MTNDRYLEIRQNILAKLVEAKSVSLTSNMWTSLNNEGYLSVTVHFIQGSTLHSAVLCTQKVEERHTGANISSHLKDVMNEWCITDKTFALVTDNAAVMVDVAKRLGVSHMGCAAHRVNLVVTDVLEHPDLEELQLLRQKCRKIVGYFKSSTLGLSELTECQLKLQLDTLKLKQETATRWNSTYFMIERLVKIKRGNNHVLILC